MEAVNEFFKGKSGVKQGFKAIVKQGLSGLIGDTTIGETTENMFFVFPENYSIVRVDVKAYKYTFSTKGVLAKERGERVRLHHGEVHRGPQESGHRLPAALRGGHDAQGQ